MADFERTVIYTALYPGVGYDTLKPLPKLEGNVDAICFTDDPNLKADGWKVRVVNRPEAHPRMKAKYFKLQPHVCLTNYDVSIWIDASVQVDASNFGIEAPKFMGDYNMVFFPHSARTDIQSELEAHVRLPKYTGANEIPIREQVAHYYAEGYHDEVRLMEYTCIVRRHFKVAPVMFDNAWWDECRRWTYADQLSGPYVLWKNHLPFALFPYTVTSQPWFKVVSSRSDL